MFRKLYPMTRMHRKLIRTISRCWITEKKVIKGSNKHLSSGFNIIQKDAPSHLNSHNLNKYEEWR